MQKRIKEKVKKYSGNEAAMRSCPGHSSQTRLLVLDEPTNGLDPAGIKELRDILKESGHEQNVAVFVSSHLLSEIELM